ncbi:MAG: hypothetical protein K9I94_10285 [Bacteroidales bacterium]|nr:hypothetical protein [Bacteroidales bacterium]
MTQGINPNDKKSLYKVAINSTAFFITSYLVIFFLHQLITVFAAVQFDIATILRSSGIEFLIGRFDWESDSVKTVFSAGPVLALVLSIPMIIIYVKAMYYDGLFKMFFFWGFVHAINLFFGAALVGALLSDGFGHVIVWSFVMDTGKLIISLIALFILLILGTTLTKPALISANSYYNFQKPDYRRTFVFFQLILPYLAGSIILLFTEYPIEMYDLFLKVCIFLILLPILMRAPVFADFYFDDEPKSIDIGWHHVIIALVLILLWKFGLDFGWRFG